MLNNFKSATTIDRATALLQHQTSHQLFHHLDRNERWGYTEYAVLLLDIHQYLHRRKTVWGISCLTGNRQGGLGCRPDT